MRVDGRKLSHAKLEEMRFEAVRRVHAGEARDMGLYTNRVFIWLAAYRRRMRRGRGTGASFSATTGLSKKRSTSFAGTANRDVVPVTQTIRSKLSKVAMNKPIHHHKAGRCPSLSRLPKTSFSLLALTALVGVCVYGVPAWATGGYTITSIGLNPEAINDNAQVVGQAGLGGANAYLYSNGTLTALGNLPGGSEGNPTGINVKGQVVAQILCRPV